MPADHASIQRTITETSNPTNIVNLDGEITQVNDWVFQHKLGSGSFAVVKLAKNIKTDEEAAVKITNKSLLRKTRTITKEGRRMVVHTALEKVHEEVSERVCFVGK